MTRDGNFGAQEIRRFLRTRWLGTGDKLVFHKEIGSTNDEAIKRSEEADSNGLLITADRQTKGKGRKGRNWENPEGINTAMSYLLKPGFPPDKASMLTLVMSLSCVKAMRTVTGKDAGIKWPNDIVINGRKLAGILTEMGIEDGRISYLVIGTGINVNSRDFPEKIRDTATSLFKETGMIWSRAELTAECANCFEEYYDIFLRDLSLKGLMDEYNRECVNTGKEVRVLDPKGEYSGTAEGIDQNGCLIVTGTDGISHEVFAGEVSVRGVYGYI